MSNKHEKNVQPTSKQIMRVKMVFPLFKLPGRIFFVVSSNSADKSMVIQILSRKTISNRVK